MVWCGVDTLGVIGYIHMIYDMLCCVLSSAAASNVDCGDVVVIVVVDQRVVTTFVGSGVVGSADGFGSMASFKSSFAWRSPHLETYSWQTLPTTTSESYPQQVQLQ